MMWYLSSTWRGRRSKSLEMSIVVFQSESQWDVDSYMIAMIYSGALCLSKYVLKWRVISLRMHDPKLAKYSISFFGLLKSKTAFLFISWACFIYLFNGFIFHWRQNFLYCPKNPSPPKLWKHQTLQTWRAPWRYQILRVVDSGGLGPMAPIPKPWEPVDHSTSLGGQKENHPPWRIHLC